MAQVAHVASVPERKVVVVATLANPVTGSLRIKCHSLVILELFNVFVFLRKYC